MKLQSSDVIQIIDLPVKFYASGNEESMISLLSKTGYFRNYDQVSVEAIQEVLFDYPEKTRDWLEWSENKRTDQGWFLKQQGSFYVLGRISGNEEFDKREFTSLLKACASFIKLEIEEMRNAS